MWTTPSGLASSDRPRRTQRSEWRRTRPHPPARPSPGIKMHSSPAAFPTTLSLPFFPFTPHRPAPTHPVAPQAAPSSIYSQRPPLSLQNRYDAASTKNAPAGSYSLVASAALSPRPSDPCLDPCTMTLVKRPAFQQVTGDLITRRP